MITLHLDRGRIAEIVDSIRNEQPIPPGPDGWTWLDLMAVAGVSQIMLAHRILPAPGRDVRDGHERSQLANQYSADLGAGVTLHMRETSRILRGEIDRQSVAEHMIQGEVFWDQASSS